MNKLEVFSSLGLKVDPFHKASFTTGDSLRVLRILTMAVESRAMVSIVGERGCGKTEAVKVALKKLGVKTVHAKREDQEKLTIADIKTAMILGLSNENVKRGGVVSSMQLRRIVGEASRKQKIVVVIEEAQRLHSATLKSLKSMREIEWLGEDELFTILLVAQSDPMNRAGVSEVRLRSDCVHMQGLTAAEAEGYVRSTVGKYFDDASLDALSDLPQAKNFLELQELLVALLYHALSSGREVVSELDVREVACRESAPLPRSGKAKPQSHPVSSGDALKSVLAKRGVSTEPTPLRSVV